MTSNTITVTAADNELYLLAFTPTASYQLAHIQSGNKNPVNLTITVQPGSYAEPATLNGVNRPITAANNYTVSIPKGTYSLVGVGFDWGVEWAFGFALNTNQPVSTSGSANAGVAWSSGLQTMVVS